MKRKQQDFQKTKLKVGKPLPKGRNETKTSFQTKKINLREQIRETAEEPTLKELLSFMKSAVIKTKYENLRKLRKYISDNEDSLSMFFPDILKELGRTLLESSADIRSETISVLGQCAKILTDIQFKSFVVPLTSYLNCMMTHLTFQVKRDSLKFLDELLNAHPSIICQSSEILFCLLNMISCKESSTVKRGSKNKDGRKLIDVINSKVSADEWRMQVLERMLAFLSEVLSEKNSSEMITDDQKEVYWNGKETLYLPLYLNSGAEPAKLDYSQYSIVSSEGCDSKNFKTFIHDLITILHAILKGFSSNRSLNENNVKYLSIVTQILCCTGEWAIQNLDSNDDLNPVQKLILICNQLLKGFPYNQQAGKFIKKNEVECVHLNLGIAYLYCMSSFLTDISNKSHAFLEKSYFDKWEIVKVYLASVFQVSGVKMSENAISQSLKICRILIQCSKLDDLAKDGVLVALLGTLDTNKFASSANDIYTFFMDLSLNYDHRNLLTTQAMRSWFQSLLKNLSFMMEFKKFVPNYLNYLKQICSRRNPYFMETLKNVPSGKWIEFLNFEDEDLQLTIIHLIVSLDKISSDFLHDLAETIRVDSFSTKTVLNLIRMLNSRFSQSSTPLLEQLEFVKFLLNLGCDTFFILNSDLDTEPLPLTDTIINFQESFGCQCIVFPSINFERHKEIFKVCEDCLTPYLANETLGKCTRLFFRDIFEENFKYPVHSVVAIIELFKTFSVLYSDQQLSEYIQNFIYSFLLYNSFVTNDVLEEHWTTYCVPAVQDCLDIIDPNDILTFMDSNIHSCSEIQLYHILRILIFLMQRRLLEVVHKNGLFGFFDKLGELEAFSKRKVFRIMLRNIYGYLTGS